MYYVYEWFIVETGEVIYVGKGTHNRYKVKKHNKLFNEMIKRFECDSRIVKEFEDEESAFEFEYERVNHFWNLGECVCNIRKGGYGGTTEWWSEEKKKWYSEFNVMKSESQRKRMSENNPMKNSETVKRVVAKKSRAVIIGDKKFSSVKEAMTYFDTTFEAIQNWCKKGINPKGDICRYADSEQIVFTGKRYNKGGSRPLEYKGKIYEAAKDLAEELGLYGSTVARWAKKGYDPQGNVCRYLDDTETHELLKHKKDDKRVRPIKVNGISYPSRAEAERSLGLKKGYLAPYISGERKNNKYICVYDNQQPSQGKSDNSTLKGSTTNE